MALITFNDFEPYRELTGNLDVTERLTPYINQAQIFDIKELMGNQFYTDLVNNYADANYQALLNGGEYTYNNLTYSFTGLKAVIVMFAYARFLANQNINVTRFGVVFKNNSDVSDRVDTKTLQAAISNAKEQGKAYWNECTEFLCNKSTDYPLWGDDPTVSSRKKGGVVVMGVGGNSNRNNRLTNYCNDCNRLNCNCYVV
jgi:hypothetical protein